MVINIAPARGCYVELDIFESVRKEFPLDLAEMQSEELGGLGALSHDERLEHASPLADPGSVET